MSNLIIGFGVGMKYPSPNNKVIGGSTPEENIENALIMEDGSYFLMEDGAYLKLEESQVSVESARTTTSTKKKRTTKVDKSYWNF